MKTFVRLVVRLVVVAFVVTFATFALLNQAPGDPAVLKAGFNASDENIDRIRDELGLDDPFLVRYVDWLGDVATGDFGTSILNGQPVADLMSSALPHTFELMVLAQVIALGVSLPLAIYAAQRPGGVIDRITAGTSFGLLAAPAFVLGLYLQYVFAVRAGWLPAVATDLPGPFTDPVENLRQLLLPALTLASGLIAVYIRLLRADLIATLQEDFVLLAQARGYTRRRVLWRHALRPSSFSLLTAAGLSTAGLLGGALIAETLFAVPGIGRLAVVSIFSEDYDVVMAVVLLLSLAFIIANFLVDLLYTVVDPRVRRGAG